MRTLVTWLCLLLASPALPLAAQTTEPAPAEESDALFTKRDLWFAGGFTLGTVALFPLDRALAGASQDSTIQAIRFFHRAGTAVEYIDRPGSFIIGGSLFAIGRLAGNERMADLGLHGTEALLLTEVITRLVKGIAGRARPRVDVDNPTDFQLMRGFGNDDFQSFPSGHASAAFAAAAAVTAETARWWPDAKPYIGTAMFGGATLVALSRMYHNMHWASDVAAGAAIGSFAGWKIVRWNHETHPGNRLDRWLLGVSIVPDGDGHAARIWLMPAPY